MKRTTMFIVLALAVQTAVAQEEGMGNLEFRDGLVYVKSTGSLFTGDMVHHHPNGTVSSRTGYRDGLQSGLDRTWDIKGTLRAEREYAEGRLHGQMKTFDHNGDLLVASTFEAGTRNGPTVWYFSDGTLRWETSFADGERDGTWSQFGPDGSLFMRSVWANGALVSRHDPHAGH